MSTGYSKNSMIRRVQVIADFQFGTGTGPRLFSEEVSFILSSTGRVRQVLLDGRRIGTVRASDGRITLGWEGARRLHGILSPPSYRVVIRDDVTEVVAEGKNVFARHVVSADPAIRAGDEVLVVDAGDALVATGSAILSGEEMLSFNYGAAVKVRHGRSPQ